MKSKFVEVELKLTVSVMIIAMFVTGVLSSCAYKLSNKVDNLPGNAGVIYAPMFKNVSTEPGVEVYFTNAIKKEILNSSAVKMVSQESKADAVLLGTITKVELLSDDAVIEAKDTKYLPSNTVLTTQTTVTVTVSMQLKRKNSSEVLWRGEFKQSRNYTPPQVTLPVINSANNLYNLSARRQTLETLSQEMMQLAFDRMVDNF